MVKVTLHQENWMICGLQVPPLLIFCEGRLTMIKEMLIQQISLQQLIHICVFTLKFLDTNKKQR